MSYPSFGNTLSTLNNEIEVLAAFLPLLGTQQCEDRVGSALTRGYLYAAATPMTIFGSLGMARAGFKALIAGISSRHYSGAHILANMGFKPQGTDLSLIMHDHDADGRYLAESRVDTLLKNLKIDDASKVKPSMKCTRWNVKMGLSTALLSVLGIVPYIHLNLTYNKLTIVARWLFPTMRVVGGFLVATMIQLIIQNRILVIVTQSLTIKAVNAGLKELSGSSKAPTEKQPVRTELTEGLYKLPKETVNDLESRLRLLEEYIGHIGDAGGGRTKQATEAGQRVSPADGNKQSDITPSAIEERRDTTDGIEESPTAQSALQGTAQISSDAVPGGWMNKYQKKLTELKGSLDEAKNIGPTHFEAIFVSTLLLAGILATVAGYIGCFILVHGAATLTGPIIWLGIEAALSVIRMFLWGWDPNGDELHPYLDFKLDSGLPFPKYNMSSEGTQNSATLLV